jgi:hypothetical protein
LLPAKSEGCAAYLDEVTVLLALFKQRRGLADVRVDPHADLEPALFQAFHIPRRIREHLRIELEIAPLVRLHPEAIEVEDAEREIAIPETVEEAGDSLLVVVRCET